MLHHCCSNLEMGQLFELARDLRIVSQSTLISRNVAKQKFINSNPPTLACPSWGVTFKTSETEFIRKSNAD